MRFRKLLVLCINLFLAEEVNSQINLVSNPSFENISACPTSFGQISLAVGWHLPITGGGNPDVYNICASQSQAGVPVNLNGLSFQYPHSGIGYAGIDVVSSSAINNWREYTQSKLIDTLSIGKTYCVSFYVSLYNSMRAYIKPIGAYFDNGTVSPPAPRGLALVTPQVYNTGQQLTDTLNWMKIEDSFTATGIESYITIGNFFTDSASDIGLIGNPSPWASYYYIDDISVIDISTPGYAGNDTLIHLGDSVFVGRPPEVGLNEDCVWYINNVAIDTVAGMWVKPIVPTTYVLKQTICGTTRYDSVRVNIVGAGINQLTIDNDILISPNPFTSQTTISFSEAQKNTTIKIMDVVGKEIKTVLFSGESLVLEKGEMQSGVYFVQITTSAGSANEKVVKRKVVVE